MFPSGSSSAEGVDEKSHQRSILGGNLKCSHNLVELGCISYYELIRTQVHHEDDLINDRIQWLIQSQTIFLAGYVAIATTKPEYVALRIAIILVGLALIVFPAVGINAAISSMNVCAGKLKKNCPIFTERGEGQDLLPELRLSDRIKKGGMAPARWMPLMFVVIWCAVGFAWEVFHAPTHTHSQTGVRGLHCSQIAVKGPNSGEVFLSCMPD